MSRCYYLDYESGGLFGTDKYICKLSGKTFFVGGASGSNDEMRVRYVCKEDCEHCEIFRNSYSEIIMKPIIEIVIGELKTNSYFEFNVLNLKSGTVIQIYNNNDVYNLLFCGDEGEWLNIYTKIAEVSNDKIFNAIDACNMCNEKCSFSKFYVKNNKEIIAAYIGELDEYTAAERSNTLINFIFCEVQEAKPIIMKAIYS